MFESLKNYISEFERIYVKSISISIGNSDFTFEEKSFLELSEMHLALALLDDCGCNARKVAQIILTATEK